MKLFKLLSVSALLMGAVTVSNAQEDASNSSSMSPSFGVKGGVNFATVNGDFDSPDSRTSFHAGVFGEFPVAEIFSLQVEALYSGQGFEYTTPEFLGVGGDKVEYQLDYINVPVLAKFYILEGLSVEAGPQFSFLVNEEIDSRPNDDAGDTDTDEAKTFEFGVAGGITFQTPMGLFATARYTQGLTDVLKERRGIDGENINNSINNGVFQIGIGFKF
ncbi:outer membrane beta-barrel protein [Flavobacterium sp. Sd200]|nr:outer membrane beta-barrel protein [Flavobacterium sp. Sd200]